MSRRGGSRVEEYEERDYYVREGPPPVRAPVRTREEVDIYSRRGPDRDNRPDFLRDDYVRTEVGGPLVIRERETETVARPMERRPVPRERSLSPVRRVVETREIRRERSPSPQVRIRERIIERSPSPPPFERVRTRIVERERERSPSPPERLTKRVVETREVRRERERSPSPVRIRERIVERRQRTPSPPPIERVHTRIIERDRESSRPSPSPSPSPPPTIRAPPIHQEIITHHRHIDHGFEYEPPRIRAPSPPPPAVSREKKTEIDIYTSKNNTEVDITKSSRARTPEPRSARRENFYDEQVVYESDRDRLRVSDTRVALSRRRSVSDVRPERERERVRVDFRDDEGEADYYARKVNERAYIGEAYNGATKDWAIVDVPPGTERVRMDGVGGGSAEITWQRYNGVRRSKFIPERERDHDSGSGSVRGEREAPTGMEISIRTERREGGGVYEREYERIETNDDRRVGLPRGPRNRVGDLWTEITKDLIVKEAIEELGYDYEETEYFYYVIKYLRYEDVLQLVELSDRIRRERADRIREITRERERVEKREREWEERERRREPVYEDERIIEREIIYDPRRPPPRGYR